MFLVFYMKTLKQSMLEKKVDDKEAVEIKTLCNQYHQKRSDIMGNTQFKPEVFGDFLGKEGISPEKIN